MAPTGRSSPIAFDREYMEVYVSEQPSQLIEYRAKGTTAIPRYYPRQHLDIEMTDGKVTVADDYLVRMGESWDLYAVQRLPGNRARFRPYNEAFDVFDVPLRDDGTLDSEDVQIVGRVAWESKPH